MIRNFKHIYTIKKLKENKLTFHNLKLILIDFVKEENSTYYQYLKLFVKLLFLEGFGNFDNDKEYELEFLPRPNSFNSKLFYQQYEDPIDYPVISMILQGFSKLLHNIKNSNEDVDNQTLINSSILGLVYVSGLRPVQLAKLSAKDIKIDTTHPTDHFHRYSILIPYAKQARYVHEKIAVKLPEEIAKIILSYIERFNLQPNGKLFEMGENAARFCSIAINTQMFEFAPESYRKGILAGELILQKYSYSDFRHHVGYSLAIAGSSAEEISYILGHSSVFNS